MNIDQQNITGVQIIARFFICNDMLQVNTLQMGVNVKSTAYDLVD